MARIRDGITDGIALTALAVGLLTLVAVPAWADDVPAPAARDIQAAVESYLDAAVQDASQVGGPGSAGYDAGFWIRGGEFLLRINLTVQARYEYFDFESGMEGTARRSLDPNAPNGFTDQVIHDLSGFSVPRTTLKLSGTAPCSMRYYVELEFGHAGQGNLLPFQGRAVGDNRLPIPIVRQSNNFSVGREAWIEWGCNDAFNVRMGLVKTPSTRQLMVPPELQLFADISMASAVTGLLMPGYTDRNRDDGLVLHGLFGCSNEFQYMVAVTNGDGGDSTRNVLDFDTSDNLAYSARLNWTFLRGKGVGYTEGAIRQSTCTWYGEVGAWGLYYADRFDRPHSAEYDRLIGGVDLALGFGGFSFTGAFTYLDLSSSAIGFDDETWMIWLVQAGYLFPGTAWEIAARWSAYNRTISAAGGDIEPKTNELGLAINYYLNGHANKLTLDASFISVDDAGGYGGFYDTYSGVPLGWDAVGDSFFVRFQWQLAL